MCLINGHGGDSGLVNDKISLVESNVVPRGEEEEEGKPEEEQELFHKGVPLSLEYLDKQSNVMGGPRKIRSRGSWSHIVSKATDA